MKPDGRCKTMPEHRAAASRSSTAGLSSSEQVGACLGEPDERSALVKHQPAALDRQVQAGLVFGRRAFLAKQERPVDQLDVDLAVLPGLDAVGDFNDLASCRFGI